MIRRHWGFLLGILFVCAVAYAESIGTFDALKLRPGTLPAAGKDGELRVDSADSNKLKKYNETTTAWEEISGSGSGVGTNYYADFQADTISNVTTFDDGGTLTDGTGGTVDYMTVQSETSNQLAGDASYQFVKGAADASGEGFSFDTETPDRTSTVGGETVYLTFNYATGGDYDNSTSGNQASIYIYRIGSNTLEACNSRDVLSGSFTNALPVASNGGQYQCSFTLESSDTSVRVIFWWTGTGTNSTSIVVDKIKVGPDAVVTAPIVTEWQSFTPSWNNFSIGNGTQDFVFMRDGPNMRIKGRVVFGSTSSISGNMGLVIPNSLTAVGTGTGDAESKSTNLLYLYDSDSTANRSAEGVLYAVNNELILTSRTGNNVTATGPFTWATSDIIDIDATFEISEWSNSNAILSTTQADHRVLRVKAINSAAQTFASGTNTLEYNSEIEDTHNAFDLSTETFTCPFTGSYDISAQVGLTADADWNGTSEVFQLNYFKNGSVYRRAGWHIPGSAQNEIVYGNKLSMDCEKGDTIVIEGNNGSGGNVSGIASGAYNYLSITGEPDFSTFSTYGPYEVQTVASSTLTPTGSAQYHNMTGNSLTLTPGTWELFGHAEFENNGSAPAYTTMAAGYYGADGANSGTEPTLLSATAGVSEVTGTIRELLLTSTDTVGLGGGTYPVPAKIVTLTDTVTIYLVTYSGQTTSANARITVDFSAKRLK